ncbi:DNA cytosine methyltransferase [Haladaptatus sp. AB643]|uniref:DNA cytosine methyltransferase n=1 Tax=Haladaptatus sp. AB643 TaxID=2934174 RepID=UPI00209C4D59|nr:DNA cytosine methyltransferase [Haladaptatus sp. AB643]MCO8242963.1 DNA cytosine methyltransferase [Haladaptatus sp. AB643]
MTSTKLKNVLDLFCGAGGLSSGFARAGYNIVTGVDNNEHSIDTFDANHDCKPIVADIEEENILDRIRDSIQANGYSCHDIDIVVGGPPCRGFSMANVQSNPEENPLNNLPTRFLEIVEEIDPEAVLIENVPRLLTISDGQYKQMILSKLKSLGYNVAQGVLKAEKFGVPQKRRRVFFMGLKLSKPTLPDPSHFEHSFDLPVTVNEAISDLPPLPTGGGGSIQMEYLTPESGISKYAQEMRRDSKEAIIMNHRTTANQEKTYRRFKHIPQGGNWRDIPERLMGNYSNRLQTHDHIYQRLIEEEPSKTVANFRKQMIVHPTQNRLLSVREAARLQSFPDDYHFKGGSFNARQQMVGDAVPVNLSYAVAKAFTLSLDSTRSIPAE